jgi:glutamate-1-semialdehyde 2,1-aminomutase
LPLQTRKSKELYEPALGVLIEASSSWSRAATDYGAYPIFAQRARGSCIFDVDGNECIDWMMALGALPLGYAHPEIVEAIVEAASTGAHFATPTTVELEVAGRLQNIVPNIERVRLAKRSGAIRLARGVTGRPKILKFEGHYPGWYDDGLVTSNVLPPTALGLRSGGLPAGPHRPRQRMLPMPCCSRRVRGRARSRVQS